MLILVPKDHFISPLSIQFLQEVFHNHWWRRVMTHVGGFSLWKDEQSNLRNVYLLGLVLWTYTLKVNVHMNFKKFFFKSWENIASGFRLGWRNYRMGTRRWRDRIQDDLGDSWLASGPVSSGSRCVSPHMCPENNGVNTVEKAKWGQGKTEITVPVIFSNSLNILSRIRSLQLMCSLCDHEVTRRGRIYIHLEQCCLKSTPTSPACWAAIDTGQSQRTQEELKRKLSSSV